jgi:4-hydroxyphenylpyruvate dioxygenase
VLDGFTACGDDDDLAADQLHELAERASVQGLRIAYEALAWGRFVNTHTPGTS